MNVPHVALGSLPLDWVIFVGLALIVAFDSYRSGAARAAALSIALSLAFVLFALLPSAAFIGPILAAQQPMVTALAFLAITVVAFFLALRLIGLEYGAAGAPVSALIAGIAAAVIVVAVWLQVDALQAIWTFGPQIKGIFAESYRFWLLAVAFTALAIARS